MTVQVELFGIPRQRAGVPRVAVTVDGPAVRLGDVLLEVSRQFPSFGAECLTGDRPSAGVAVNLDGHQFVADPETLVQAGQSLLIMSADAGG